VYIITRALSRERLGSSEQQNEGVRETYGPPDVLVLEEVPLTLRDGDVLVSRMTVTTPLRMT
jgi:hypothetical protein